MVDDAIAPIVTDNFLKFAGTLWCCLSLWFLSKIVLIAFYFEATNLRLIALFGSYWKQFLVFFGEIVKL